MTTGADKVVVDVAGQVQAVEVAEGEARDSLGVTSNLHPQTTPPIGSPADSPMSGLSAQQPSPSTAKK